MITLSEYKRRTLKRKPVAAQRIRLRGGDGHGRRRSTEESGAGDCQCGIWIGVVGAGDRRRNGPRPGIHRCFRRRLRGRSDRRRVRHLAAQPQPPKPGPVGSISAGQVDAGQQAPLGSRSVRRRGISGMQVSTSISGCLLPGRWRPGSPVRHRLRSTADRCSTAPELIGRTREQAGHAENDHCRSLPILWMGASREIWCGKWVPAAGFATHLWVAGWGG